MKWKFAYTFATVYCVCMSRGKWNQLNHFKSNKQKNTTKRCAIDLPATGPLVNTPVPLSKVSLLGSHYALAGLLVDFLTTSCTSTCKAVSSVIPQMSKR